MGDRVESFKDLRVWRLSMDIAKKIYALTDTFPKNQNFIIIQQLQRASISIPSNIAEGFGRDGLGEYLYHLSVALGSCAELETQIILSSEIGYLSKKDSDEVLIEIDYLAKMLKNLSKSLKSKKLTTIKQ